MIRPPSPGAGSVGHRLPFAIPLDSSTISYISYIKYKSYGNRPGDRAAALFVKSVVVEQ
jgi:hypothetical protein